MTCPTRRRWLAANFSRPAAGAEGEVAVVEVEEEEEEVGEGKVVATTEEEEAVVKESIAGNTHDQRSRGKTRAFKTITIHWVLCQRKNEMSSGSLSAKIFPTASALQAPEATL